MSINEQIHWYLAATPEISRKRTNMYVRNQAPALLLWEQTGHITDLLFDDVGYRNLNSIEWSVAHVYVKS